MKNAQTTLKACVALDSQADKISLTELPRKIPDNVAIVEAIVRLYGFGQRGAPYLKNTCGPSVANCIEFRSSVPGLRDVRVFADPEQIYFGRNLDGLAPVRCVSLEELVKTLRYALQLAGGQA